MSGPETPALAEAAVEGGADLVELGFPFSDPLADGPTIRRAAERALAAGMRTAACLDCLAQVRARVDVPLVPMTYSSLLEAYGWERFALDAHAAGAGSLIVADLPVDERPELRRVQLVAPTSTDERIALAAASTDGWLYLVALTGTTGARTEALVGARRPGDARAASRSGHAAVRRLRHLHARAGPDGGRRHGRGRRRLPRRRGRRGGPCGTARLRPLAARRARRALTRIGDQNRAVRGAGTRSSGDTGTAGRRQRWWVHVGGSPRHLHRRGK